MKSHSVINDRCRGGATDLGRIYECQQCGVTTVSSGCYSAYASSDQAVNDCIIHLCLTCAAPYIALDALRA